MKVKVYEGLKADRFTYIDTNMPYLGRYVIKSKWKLVKNDVSITNYPPMYGSSAPSPNHINHARYWYVNNAYYSNIETRFGESLKTKSFPFQENIEIVDTPSGFSLNGVEYGFPRLDEDLTYTIQVFQFEGHKSVPRYHTCNYFIIEDNGSEVIHLVPCLTESNEACMIDLLSGELYRNKGTGNFSVEGEMLYEFETPSISRLMRKPKVVVRLREQLRGDGTIINFIGAQEVINGSIEYIPLKASGGTIHQIGSMGYLYANHESYRIFWLTYAGENTLFIDHHKLNEGVRTSERNTIALAEGEKAHIEFNGGKVLVNNMTPKITARNIDLSYNHPDILFGNTKSIVGKVTINGTTFHPCDILLHPTLPPQSAMINLLTGDLYTNQGSGSFTCEGKILDIWTDTTFKEFQIKDTKADMVVVKQNGKPKVVYEKMPPYIKHKWLVTDGNARAEIYDVQNIQKIKVPFILSEQIYSSVLSILFGYRIGILELDELNLRNQGGKNYLYYRINNNGNYYGFDAKTDENIFALDNGGVYINNNLIIPNVVASGSRWGWFSRAYGNESFNNLIGCKIGENDFVADNYNLHLVPCQLTRPLLDEDINGIPRQAGECGLADERRYKMRLPWFFGNVAKNAQGEIVGSFGVSDE